MTAECVRVLKPSGSLWVNLGDKMATTSPVGSGGKGPASLVHGKGSNLKANTQADARRVDNAGIPAKSLMGLPWRYAIGCIDQLGLICRAEVIWSKPNGLPESVTDRVRRSHEQWFHFTKEPRYFSAVDEVREASTGRSQAGGPWLAKIEGSVLGRETNPHGGLGDYEPNPLGKLPGSVWTVPTEPLRVPDHLGVDHFAAFPSEWPRRIILGWSPSGVCVECGEGRRPVVAKELVGGTPFAGRDYRRLANGATGGPAPSTVGSTKATITGYACACPTTDAPTRPAVVLDPFCGTGTVPAVAHALGRHGIGIDLSADYLRLADWRCNDPVLRAKVLRVDKPTPIPDGQLDLFGGAA